MILYETFDLENATVLADLRVFFKWKKQTMCKDLHPLTNAVMLSQKDDSHKEFLPTLSKAKL